MLLEVSALLLVDEHEIDHVFDWEAIIDVGVGRSQVRRGQVEAYGDEFPLDRRAIHQLKLSQCFALSGGVGALAHCLFPHDAELHELYLDPHQVEAHLAQDAVFQVVALLVELELDVEALLDAHFHLDLLVLFLLLLDNVVHDEFLLLRDAIVASIDANIDEVADAHIDPIVRLKLLLNPIKRKIVCHVIGKGSRRLKVSH